MFGKKDPSIDAAGDEAYIAILILATEDLPLKERLSMAWLEAFSKLEEERLSREFQKSLRYIAKYFPRDELAGDSISNLTPYQANSLARRMVDFALDLEAMK